MIDNNDLRLLKFVAILNKARPRSVPDEYTVGHTGRRWIYIWSNSGFRVEKATGKIFGFGKSQYGTLDTIKEYNWIPSQHNPNKFKHDLPARAKLKASK